MGETNEDGDSLCPLCMEEMDLTDRHLRPCHCGYQLCVWCWHQIMELAAKDNIEGRCPACRTPYDKEKIVGAASSCEELIDLAADKRRPHKVKSKAMESRKHLSNVRVMQRNLVYVVGFPLNLADEETLERREFFGQYGRILKVAMPRLSSYNGQHSHSGPTASVYVTYVREEDALRCIRAVDGCILEGKLLRACFGTNKYCNAWLKNMPCNNSDCLYLHDEGAEEDSFTKEEMLAKCGSKNQHFHELTHPPHRVVGIGLPAPLPEASNLCSSVSSVSQVHHPTSRTLGRPLVSSSSPGKAISLPAASSWGMHGKAPATKASQNTNLPKKRSAGLTCSPACSSSSLCNPSLTGVVPLSSCDEPKQFAHIADAVDGHCYASSNFRTTKPDVLPLVQNDVKRYDVGEQVTSLSQSVHCSDPSMQLNVGDVSISLISSPPINMTPVHNENLIKQDSIFISSVVFENTMDARDKGSTFINPSIVADKDEVNDAEDFKSLTYESSVRVNNLLVADNISLQVPKSMKAVNKSPFQWRSDDSIISDILTMEFNVDGSFHSPVDLEKLLRAGSANPLTADKCNKLPVSWKSQPSSQSRFLFARPKVHEKLHGASKSNCSSSGEFDNPQIAHSQMQFPETMGSIVYSDDNMDAVSGKLSFLDNDFDHPMGTLPKASSCLHEQISREGSPVCRTQSAGTSSSLMSTKKDRPDVPPGFSTTAKFSSVLPPGLNPQNAAGNSNYHGLIGEAISSGLCDAAIAPTHVTDKQNAIELELIDPAIMAVGKGNLPCSVGCLLDAAQAVPFFLESPLPHRSFMKGASGMHFDNFDLGPTLAPAHHQPVTANVDALLKQQRERGSLMENMYYSLPYQLEEHSNDPVVHSLLRPPSVMDGALPQRMITNYEGNYISPKSRTPAVHNSADFFLNMTKSSTVGSLEPRGLGQDVYCPAQLQVPQMRSSTTIGRLDSQPDGSLDSLNLETALRNMYLSSLKQEFLSSSFDCYSSEPSLLSTRSISRLDNGQHPVDRSS